MLERRRRVLAPALLALTIVGPALWAQHPSELTVRDKTQLFIQHVVKFLDVEPEKYQSLVLEYEIGAALAEATSAHEHETGCIHDQVTHLSRHFIENALRELYPEYGKALELATADADRDAEARAAIEPLLAHRDPYVAAHARMLLAELAWRAGDIDATVEHCEEIIAKHRARLIGDHRACELVALAFEKSEKPLLALAQYAILLTDYQEIPKEVEERAKEKLVAMQRETGEPLQLVAGWMNEVEKALGSEVTGDPTQTQESEIVTALGKLIELEEARERKACSGCGGDCKGGSCKNGRHMAQRSNNPAQRSTLPNGGNPRMNLHGVSRANAESIWGQLRMQDAARALQAFSGKLPARYEKLLEQYYKDLSRDE